MNLINFEKRTKLSIAIFFFFRGGAPVAIRGCPLPSSVRYAHVFYCFWPPKPNQMGQCCCWSCKVAHAQKGVSANNGLEFWLLWSSPCHKMSRNFPFLFNFKWQYFDMWYLMLLNMYNFRCNRYIEILPPKLSHKKLPSQRNSACSYYNKYFVKCIIVYLISLLINHSLVKFKSSI